MKTLRDYKPKAYEMGFDTEVDAEVYAMYREAQWFVNDVVQKQPKRWLSLLGRSGTGKTHLAKAISDKIKEARPKWYVRFQPWTKVVDALQDRDYAIIDRMIEFPDVLVIDDIGAECLSGYKKDEARAALYKLLDGRQGKWTVITSNLTLGQISDEIDGRIASRMVRNGSVICEVFDADDYSFKRYMESNHSKGGKDDAW